MRLDPHSYADSDQPRVTDLQLNATIDFESHTLRAEATLAFAALGTGPLDLDTRELHIESVVDESEQPLRFELGANDTIVGARLRITLARPTSAVRISYRTSPNASALQWLTPAQTSDGTHPFVFSQCQAIHARSIVPLQDTPRHRLRYRASLTVPKELKALMAARQLDRVEHHALAVERFEMLEPIPPYLLAFAVGRLVSRDIGPRSRVWAEPGQLDAAAHEFAEVEPMMAAGEKLFGRYPWERFDLLVMPRSFPYGGMENPRLTFVTPTLIAGDRSLVSVVAHELAHSWTGNLVTNASAEHFWLNEGFTVYAERRIVEALHGTERAELEAALGLRDLQQTIARFAKTPELTRLRTELQGVDPDETFSEIPYEKGYAFLRALEHAAGRERFDTFLREYIAHFEFQSITTEEFLAFAEKKLSGAFQKVDVQAWLFQPGLPANVNAPSSARLALIENSTEHVIAEGLGRSFFAHRVAALPRVVAPAGLGAVPR